MISINYHDFHKLSKEQTDYLMNWMRKYEGVKCNALNFKSNIKRKKDPRSVKLITNLVVDTRRRNSESQSKQMNV